MSQPEGANPERHSNGALICFCVGVALETLAWFFGVGAVITAGLAGDNPAIAVGGILAAASLSALAMIGFILMVVGSIWMLIQVIADQRGNDEARYRDVER